MKYNLTRFYKIFVFFSRMHEKFLGKLYSNIPHYDSKCSSAVARKEEDL